MSTAPTPDLAPARTNSLALAFQDVITVVLRMRYGAQRVPDAAAFRANIRNMIVSAVTNVRALRYSDNASKMALYAIVAFLDESVLNSGDPAFADWARRPLQEEMFGGHIAGEAFFNNLTGLLNGPDSMEVADALELHAILLLLGYRGRYALGNAGNLIPEVRFESKRDRWLTSLWIAASCLAALVVVLFVVYTLTLGSGLSAIHTASLDLPANSAKGLSL